MNETQKFIFGEVELENPHFENWSNVERYMEPIIPYYLKDGVEEIFIDRFDKIIIRQDCKNILTDCRFDTEQHLLDFLDQLAKSNGLNFGRHSPMIDVRFPDRSRGNLLFYNVSPNGISATIRVASKNRFTPQDLLNRDVISKEMLEYISKVIEMESNVVISGGMGSGKTTLMNVVSAFIPDDVRVVSCEDTQELFLYVAFHQPIEAPGKNEANITFEDLLVNSLRMGPNRIWAGEIRNASAAYQFFKMLNVGHSGCLTTLHAKNALYALKRICYLCTEQTRIDPSVFKEDLCDLVDVFVHAEMRPEFGRKIIQIAEMQNGQMVDVFTYDKKAGQFKQNEQALKNSKYV